MKNHQGGMIPRLYMKLLPIQILLAIIGGMKITQETVRIELLREA